MPNKEQQKSPTLSELINRQWYSDEPLTPGEIQYGMQLITQARDVEGKCLSCKVLNEIYGAKFVIQKPIEGCSSCKVHSLDLLYKRIHQTH